MADRRPPYARTLAVLRVLTWPYQYPPLSWLVKFNDWVGTNTRRFAATWAACWIVIAAAIVWQVLHG